MVPRIGTIKVLVSRIIVVNTRLKKLKIMKILTWKHLNLSCPSRIFNKTEVELVKQGQDAEEQRNHLSTNNEINEKNHQVLYRYILVG